MYIATAMVGAFFLIIEMILQSFGIRTCETEGCKLVAQYTGFDDISMLIVM